MEEDETKINYAQVLSETSKARHFDFGDEERFWIPKSQHKLVENEKAVILKDWKFKELFPNG